jgi:hypothetical protein
LISDRWDGYKKKKIKSTSEISGKDFEQDSHVEKKYWTNKNSFDVFLLFF